MPGKSSADIPARRWLDHGALNRHLSLTAQAGPGPSYHGVILGSGYGPGENVGAGRGKIGGVRSDPSPIAIARGEIR